MRNRHNVIISSKTLNKLMRATRTNARNKGNDHTKPVWNSTMWSHTIIAMVMTYLTMQYWQQLHFVSDSAVADYLLMKVSYLHFLDSFLLAIFVKYRSCIPSSCLKGLMLWSVSEDIPKIYQKIIFSAFQKSNGRWTSMCKPLRNTLLDTSPTI